MSWNYRVVHTVHGAVETFAIYEVFYDDQGEPEARMEHPSYPAGETLEEFSEDVRHYLRALEQPVLEETVFTRHAPDEG
jgi:hypothetical protein